MSVITALFCTSSLRNGYEYFDYSYTERFKSMEAAK